MLLLKHTQPACSSRFFDKKVLKEDEQQNHGIIAQESKTVSKTICLKNC
jgi:hypothetical protein